MLLNCEAIHETLEWPGNSPDLNPIKNLGAIVKKTLRKHDCRTKTKIFQLIIDIGFCDQDMKNICNSLTESMPKCLELVIKAKGSHTKH